MRAHQAILLILLSISHAAGQDYMELAWDYQTKEIMSGMDVDDVTGDGRADIVVSGSSDGSVYVIDAEGGLVWRKDVFSYINTVLSEDLEGDGTGDVVAGHSDLSVFDDKGNSWKYRTGQGVYELESAEMNADGVKDIIVGSYEKNCRSKSFIYAIDARNRDDLWKYSLDYSIPEAIKVADLDKDGIEEIIVGLIYRVKSSYKPCTKTEDHGSKVIVLNHDKSVLWEHTTSGAVYSIDTADVTGDGEIDVVVGTYDTLYVIDSEGELVWMDQTTIADMIVDVKAVDLDSDNKSEIIAASNEVYAFDSEGEMLWMAETDFSRSYVLETGDLDGDGSPEIMAGSAHLYVWDKEGSVRYKSSPYGFIGFLEAADLNNDGYEEVVLGSKRNVTAYHTTSYAKRVLADQLFDEAVAQSKLDAQKALDRFKRAKALYSELGLIERVSLCINQVNKLDDTEAMVEDIRAEAELALEKANNYLQLEDYINATKYANVARSKYASPGLNDEVKINESDEIIRQSSEKVAEAAIGHLAQANTSSHNGNLSSALQHAKKAQSMFSYIGYQEQAEKAKELVRKLEERQNGEKKGEKKIEIPDVSKITTIVKTIDPLYIIIILILAVIIVILGLIIVYIWKSAKRERLRSEHLHRVYYEKHLVKTQPPVSYGKKKGRTKKYDTSKPEEKREDILVELPPNKGVFRSRTCRKGLCLKMEKINR